jgi:hypothetical protein
MEFKSYPEQSSRQPLILKYYLKSYTEMMLVNISGSPGDNGTNVPPSRLMLSKLWE